MSPMVPMTERVSENLPSVNVHQMIGPQTPMTPMTPSSSDPAILPQLQYEQYDFTIKTLWTVKYLTALSLSVTEILYQP